MADQYPCGTQPHGYDPYGQHGSTEGPAFVVHYGAPYQQQELAYQQATGLQYHAHDAAGAPYDGNAAQGYGQYGAAVSYGYAADFMGHDDYGTAYINAPHNVQTHDFAEARLRQNTRTVLTLFAMPGKVCCRRLCWHPCKRRG